MAACASTVRVFDLILKQGAQLEPSFALHNAASVEFTDERKKLMEHLIKDHHVDVNQIDDAMGPHAKGTPLFYAARSGNIEGTRFLLEHGADASVKNHRGLTAADDAERFSKKEVADLLRESRIG
jgi:ankyrin repeat protein